jgi:hypothetical protein
MLQRRRSKIVVVATIDAGNEVAQCLRVLHEYQTTGRPDGCCLPRMQQVPPVSSVYNASLGRIRAPCSRPPGEPLDGIHLPTPALPVWCIRRSDSISVTQSAMATAAAAAAAAASTTTRGASATVARHRSALRVGWLTGSSWSDGDDTEGHGVQPTHA